MKVGRPDHLHVDGEDRVLFDSDWAEVLKSWHLSSAIQSET